MRTSSMISSFSALFFIVANSAAQAGDPGALAAMLSARVQKVMGVAYRAWRAYLLEVDPSLQHVKLEKVVSGATGQVAWVAPSNVDAWQSAQH